jgi:hypothetical protein
VTDRKEGAYPGIGGDATELRNWRRVPLLVTLLACGVFAACSSSTPDEAPPKSPRDQYSNAQKVILDGQEYSEYDYFDIRVQVPIRTTGGVTGPNPPPSWPIPLPSDLRERDRAQIEKQIAGGNYDGLDDMSVFVRVPSLNWPRQPIDETLVQLETQDPLLLEPVETREDWGLALYRSPELARIASPGEGYWVPTDPRIRRADGSRIVILCASTTSWAGGFPHGLRCGWDMPLSEETYAQFGFRGTYLGDWRRIYELGTSTVQQRVATQAGAER